MHMVKRLEFEGWTYTFPDGQTRYNPSGFRDALTQTTRLPGMNGAVDQFGYAAAPSAVGDIQIEIIYSSENVEAIQTFIDDTGLLLNEGIGRLWVQPEYGPERFAYVRVNAETFSQNVKNVPHTMQRITFNFQVADAHFYSDSGYWFPTLGDGFDLNDGLTLGENAYEIEVDGETLGVEALPDPDLDTGTGWTEVEVDTGTVTFAAGTATFTTADANDEAAITAAVLTPGQLYRFTVVVNSITGTLGARAGSTYPDFEMTAAGTHTFDAAAEDATFRLGSVGEAVTAEVASVSAVPLTLGAEVTVAVGGNATALPVLAVIPGVGDSCEDVRVQRIVQGATVDEVRYRPVLSAGDELMVNGAMQFIHVNGVRTFKPDVNWKHPDFMRLLPGNNTLRIRMKNGSDAATVYLWWLNTWR